MVSCVPMFPKSKTYMASVIHLTVIQSKNSISQYAWCMALCFYQMFVPSQILESEYSTYCLLPEFDLYCDSFFMLLLSYDCLSKARQFMQLQAKILDPWTYSVNKSCIIRCCSNKMNQIVANMMLSQFCEGQLHYVISLFQTWVITFLENG